MAAMHHVIVEREHHQRGIRDDAAELARVEGVVAHRLPRAQRFEPRDDVGCRQDIDGGVGHDRVMIPPWYEDRCSWPRYSRWRRPYWQPRSSGRGRRRIPTRPTTTDGYSRGYAT